MSKIKESKMKTNEKELAEDFSNQSYQNICRLKFELQGVSNKKVE